LFFQTLDIICYLLFAICYLPFGALIQNLFDLMDKLYLA